jgi:hypothetical protein
MFTQINIKRVNNVKCLTKAKCLTKSKLRTIITEQTREADQAVDRHKVKEGKILSPRHVTRSANQSHPRSRDDASCLLLAARNMSRAARSTRDLSRGAPRHCYHGCRSTKLSILTAVQCLILLPGNIFDIELQCKL